MEIQIRSFSADSFYDRSLHGRSNNENVRIDKCKRIKVILGGFANMFSRTPVEIVAALGIVCRLSKHARERKPDGRKAVGDLSSSGRGRAFLCMRNFMSCKMVDSVEQPNAEFFGNFALGLATFLNLADLSDFRYLADLADLP